MGQLDFKLAYLAEKTKMVIKTFWLLLGIFVFVLGQLFVPSIRNLFEGSLLFLLPFIIFSLCGAILILLTLKKKVEGNLKKFLLLTGISASGIFVGILLHNFFYALGIMTEHIFWLNHLFELLHVVFFITATIICPVGFLIGTIGVIICFRKTPKPPH